MARFHSSDCKCCACRLKRNALTEMDLSAKPRRLKPCTCGSPVCKKNWMQMKRERRNWQIQKNLKIKKCVCGSPICAEESQKMPEMLLEAAKQADHEQFLAKQKVIKEKLYQKARKKRIKDREKSLKKQIKLQREEDMRQMKYIKKAERAGSIIMAAESLIDLGTFGSKAFCNIARYICKGVKHPRDAIQDMKDAIQDPDHAAEAMKKNIEGIGLKGTIDRIKHRFTRMPVGKSIVTKMESYPTTNYLIHMADSNPKKRMKKFKTRRYREPKDFECSLYMASMRKRPCLRVYYMCPWFYPHCMSLLQVYKQVLDIFLFLLAVFIWSPCILFMELCRGCVCCFMCQG